MSTRPRLCLRRNCASVVFSNSVERGKVYCGVLCATVDRISSKHDKALTTTITTPQYHARAVREAELWVGVLAALDAWSGEAAQSTHVQRARTQALADALAQTDGQQPQHEHTAA